MQNVKLLLGILAITTALAVKVQAQTFLTNDLVAYYPFDGNANDASGNGNNGTVQDATSTNNMFGVQNSAYHFNGSNAVVNLPNATFNNMSAGTIAAWVELYVNSHEPIFAKQDDGVNSYGVFTVGCYSSNEGVATIGTPGTLYFHSQNDAPLVTSSTLLTTGVWYYVAVTFSTTNCSLYINGALSGEASGNFSSPNDTSAVTSIGAWQNKNGTFSFLSSGIITDLRIYSVALTSTEVAQSYSIESAPMVEVQKAVYLAVNNLWTGSNYQIQASSDLINWTNQGSVFTATNSIWQSTNYWNVNNWNQLFFRLELVP